MAATPSLGGAQSALVRARQNLCCQVTLVAGTFPPPKVPAGLLRSASCCEAGLMTGWLKVKKKGSSDRTASWYDEVVTEQGACVH